MEAAATPRSVQRAEHHGAVEVRARDVVVVASEAQCGAPVQVGPRAAVGSQGEHLHVGLRFAEVRQNVKLMPADACRHVAAPAPDGSVKREIRHPLRGHGDAVNPRHTDARLGR